MSGLLFSRVGLQAGVLIALGSVVPVVSAAPVSFDFSGSGGNESSYTFASASGLSVTVGAFFTPPDTATNVHQNGDGLGANQGFLDQNTVDGLGKDEWLTLTFSEEVEILSITFSRIFAGDLNNDGSGFGIDGNFVAGDLIASGLGLVGASTDCGGGLCTVGMAGLSLSGTEIRLGDFDPDYSLDSNDNFRIKSVTVQQQVPEPGTVLLLLAGLGLTALTARPGLNRRA